MIGRPAGAHVRLTELVQAKQWLSEAGMEGSDGVVAKNLDQDVKGPQDLNGKAKLVGMELVSVPDLLSHDPRKGRVWMTNNQIYHQMAVLKGPQAGIHHFAFRLEDWAEVGKASHEVIQKTGRRC